MNAFFVSTLRPQVFIIPVWSADHPGHTVLARLLSKRLYSEARDIFATNMIEANRIVIGPMLDQLKSSQGHILLRVENGGIFPRDHHRRLHPRATGQVDHGPYQSR
jgi:hypothetical protein